MGAIFTSHQAYPRHPFIDEPGILAGAEVAVVIYPAWRDIILHRAAAAFKPCQHAGPGIREQFELNRPTGFLLHHDCARPNLSAADNVADFHLHEVATSQLAVNRKVEQGQIS